MKTVVFPASHIKPLYYNIHIRYLMEFFKEAGYRVRTEGETSTSPTSFTITIDDKKYAVCFSDFQEVTDPTNLPCIKLHCSEEILKQNRKIVPFPPVSFYSWKEYEALSKEIEYKANTDLVLNMQRPYAGAKERRTKVQSLLSSYQGEIDLRSNIPQHNFWKRINDCLVAVFVPGARNDMIDRGSLQYLAFGCCIISPLITDVFWEGVRLIPNLHYIQCRPDYSDLLDRIEWAKNNRQNCIEMGKEAKVFFEDFCLPCNLSKILA